MRDTGTAKEDLKSAVDASRLDSSLPGLDSGGPDLDPSPSDMAQDLGDMAALPKSACLAIFGRPCGELETPALSGPGGTYRGEISSVAIDGDLVAIGVVDDNCAGVSPPEDAPGGKTCSAGEAVHLYKRGKGGDWALTARFKPSSLTQGKAFGRSVAIEGNLMVVGAPLDSTCLEGVNPPGDDMLNLCEGFGAAYIFERDPVTDQWSQSAYIKSTTSGGAFMLFGDSVAVDGDTVVVSAPYDSNCAEGINQGQGENYGCTHAGSVYVYERDGTTKEWQQAFYIKPSLPRTETRFGEVMALDGDVLAVTSVFEDGCVGGVNPTQIFNSNVCHQTGAVYLFTRQTQTNMWEQTAYLKASFPDASDLFGYSLALEKDTLAVGAPGEDSCPGAGEADNSCKDSGAVYLFEKESVTTMWRQTFLLKAPPTSASLFGVYQLHDGVLAASSYQNKLCPTGLNAPGKVEDAICEARQGVEFFKRNQGGTSWDHVGYAKSPAPTRFKTFFGHTFLNDEALTIIQPKNTECKDGLIVPEGEFKPVPCSDENDIYTYPFLP